MPTKAKEFKKASKGCQSINLVFQNNQSDVVDDLQQLEVEEEFEVEGISEQKQKKKRWKSISPWRSIQGYLGTYSNALSSFWQVPFSKTKPLVRERKCQPQMVPKIPMAALQQGKWYATLL